MSGDFSRRAVYRHRTNHMLQAVCPARRPVPFPHGHSALKRLRWVQREVEHTAALAEYKGELGLKLRALHELGRLLWLESKWDSEDKPPVDVVTRLTAAEAHEEYHRYLERGRERREKALSGERNLSSIGGLRNGDEV
jgi:hypothetical protein